MSGRKPSGEAGVAHAAPAAAFGCEYVHEGPPERSCERSATVVLSGQLVDDESAKLVPSWVTLHEYGRGSYVAMVCRPHALAAQLDDVLAQGAVDDLTEQLLDQLACARAEEVARLDAICEAGGCRPCTACGSYECAGCVGGGREQGSWHRCDFDTERGWIA